MFQFPPRFSLFGRYSVATQLVSDIMIVIHQMPYVYTTSSLQHSSITLSINLQATHPEQDVRRQMDAIVNRLNGSHFGRHCRSLNSFSNSLLSVPTQANEDDAWLEDSILVMHHCHILATACFFCLFFFIWAKKWCNLSKRINKSTLHRNYYRKLKK